MFFDRRLTIIIVVFIWGIEATDEYKIVNTQYGSVRGIISKTLIEHRPIASFTGIPFARPPVGRFRFEVFILIDIAIQVYLNAK